MDVLEKEFNKEKITSLLMSFRHLFKSIVFNEEKVWNDLCSSTSSSHKVFPCDFIDLRDILLTEEISSVRNIVFFPQSFAEKYLKRYPIFLIIDVSNIQKIEIPCKELIILENTVFDISNSLVRIEVNSPNSYDMFSKVHELLNELKRPVECIISNSVPGISGFHPKLEEQ